ncbi:MAG: PilZ domain-containing protein [Anaerolineae bacterium]|nr:PilZ domain-containing protein [Anaerolineae bacterium]
MSDRVLKNEETQQRETNSTIQGFENRRQHVRIFYPPRCPVKFLPEMIVNHHNCLVLDISEGGIRFAISNALLIKQRTLTALLRFPDGGEIEITGEVVRRNYNQVALKLEKGIPYSRIMSEQLRLRNLETNGVISPPYTTRS